jgi:signal peptidase II
MQTSVEKRSWFSKIFYMFVTSVIILVVDQGVKRIALRYGNMELEKNISLKFKGVEHEILNFSMFVDINKGISFGLLSNFIGRHSKWIIPLMVSFVLMIFIVPAISSSELVSKGMIIGGAVSNIIDRMYFSGVVDFISIRFFDGYINLIVNLADLFIFFGLVIICLSVFLRRLKK